MPDPKGLEKVLGKVSSPAHKKYVDRIVERHDFFIKQSSEVWVSSVEDMRLYLSQRDDPREEEDAWRANVFVPKPWEVSNTKTATVVDILLAPDPPIQPEAVGDEDYDTARHTERLLDYTLRKNRWRKKLAGLIQMASIQGTAFFKLLWADKSIPVTVYKDQAALEEFQKGLADAFQVLGVSAGQVPDHVLDPAGFMAWRETVNASGRAKVPELPQGGKREIVRYRGPWIEHITSLYDLRLDPLVDEIEDQPLVIHRMVKSHDWLRGKAGKGKEGIYDPEALEECLRAGYDTKLTQQEQEINSFLGIPSGPDTDPEMQGNAAEVLECWSPASEIKYTVLVNRAGAVNKDPLQLPFQHGETAVHALRNVFLPGRMFGISDLRPPRALFEELNSLRNLRIDRTTLETLPAFGKLVEMGLPEQRRRLVPGALIPQARPDSLQQLIKYSPTNAFQDLDLIENNIDSSAATWGNVAGAPAEVNRVSATESQGRTQQALTRHKLMAVMAEEDLQSSVDQMLWLWYQKGDPETRMRIGGGPDPFITLNRSYLLESLEMDFRFRGATRVLDRPRLVQQLQQFLKDNGAVLIPPEYRAVMKQILEVSGVKGIARMISRLGDQFFLDTFTLQAMTAKAQLGQLRLQTAAASVVPPSSVDPATAQALAPPPVAVPLEQGGGVNGVTGAPGAAPAAPQQPQ